MFFWVKFYSSSYIHLVRSVLDWINCCWTLFLTWSDCPWLDLDIVRTEVGVLLRWELDWAVEHNWPVSSRWERPHVQVICRSISWSQHCPPPSLPPPLHCEWCKLSWPASLSSLSLSYLLSPHMNHSGPGRGPPCPRLFWSLSCCLPLCYPGPHWSVGFSSCSSHQPLARALLHYGVLISNKNK